MTLAQTGAHDCTNDKKARESHRRGARCVYDVGTVGRPGTRAHRKFLGNFSKLLLLAERRYHGGLYLICYQIERDVLFQKEDVFDQFVRSLVLTQRGRRWGGASLQFPPTFSAVRWAGFIRPPSIWDSAEPNGKCPVWPRSHKLWTLGHLQTPMQYSQCHSVSLQGSIAGA
jgi:hypothetical protein